MGIYCPDHTLSAWALEAGFEDGGTLAIITDWDGMAVWELGLRPGDDGFPSMSKLAQDLCDLHNALFDVVGKVPLEEGGSVAAGFAEDLSGRYWENGVVSSEGNGSFPGVRAYGGDAACILGSAVGIPSNAEVGMAAERIVNLHNALLAARP